MTNRMRMLIWVYYSDFIFLCSHIKIRKSVRDLKYDINFIMLKLVLQTQVYSLVKLGCSLSDKISPISRKTDIQDLSDSKTTLNF